MEFWMSLEDLRKTSKCIQINAFLNTSTCLWHVFDMFAGQCRRSFWRPILGFRHVSCRWCLHEPRPRLREKWQNFHTFYAFMLYVTLFCEATLAMSVFADLLVFDDLEIHWKFPRMEEIYNGSYLSKAICESPQRARGQLNLKERSCGAIHLRHNHPVFTVFSCIWEIVVCFNRCGFAEEQEENQRLTKSKKQHNMCTRKHWCQGPKARRQNKRLFEDLFVSVFFLQIYCVLQCCG